MTQDIRRGAGGAMFVQGTTGVDPGHGMGQHMLVQRKSPIRKFLNNTSLL
ncbi:hypothetical protein [Komagataeibacter sp. FNDCF1]|nr:hypothetical protein [Komagataeibacter sp. FNDCF1]MCE2563662.1 hypothetical protein [Komagataeibacter sp. FNDCF1]